MTKTVLSRTQEYVRAKDIVATDMDGELVMMDIGTGSYFAINGSGPAIWDRLTEPLLIDDLIASLGDEFDTGPKAQFEAEVSDFVANLVDQGLVKPAD